MLSSEAENCPRDPTPTHRGHAVDDVVVGIGMPRSIDLGIGIIWPGSERKDGEWPGLIGHEETVSMRDVFLSVNAAWIPVGPLSCIPIRLHERAGMLIRTLNELEVFRGGDSNLHVSMIGPPVGRLVFCLLSPMGGVLGPLGGELTRLVAVLAARQAAT